MGKIIIEVENGKILAVYGSEEMEVAIYEDLNTKNLTDEEEDFLDEEAASVPYILYRAE